jgi:hypothetical protein
MSDRVLLAAGVRVPRFLYGTAWTEDHWGSAWCP